MSYNLFLDDERNVEDVTWIKLLPEPYKIVRTYDDFVKCIEQNGLPKNISFDHDLGTDKTGYDCAKWLVSYCMFNQLDVPNYTIHSKNPIGADNIKGYIENYKTRR